jgi:threonyl-tRNA synthetase
MIHRAPFGSMERFTGILIEHFAGAFPVWLSPTQVTVLTISEKVNDYAKSVHAKLVAAGVRAEIDLSGDKIGGKIRRAREARIPYMLVIGGKEAESGAVAIRTRKDKDLGTMPADAFVEKIKAEIRTRALPSE